MDRFINKKASDHLDKIIKLLPDINNVDSGKCRYNYRCQFNAVHEALKGKHNEIAMVMYKRKCDKGDWSIHFLNVPSKGVYVDNTLGYNSIYWDYKFVRFIKKNKYIQIGYEFKTYSDYLHSLLPFWLRILSSKEH